VRMSTGRMIHSLVTSLVRKHLAKRTRQRIARLPNGKGGTAPRSVPMTVTQTVTMTVTA